MLALLAKDLTRDMLSLLALVAAAPEERPALAKAVAGRLRDRDIRAAAAKLAAGGSLGEAVSGLPESSIGNPLKLAATHAATDTAAAGRLREAAAQLRILLREDAVTLTRRLPRILDDLRYTGFVLAVAGVTGLALGTFVMPTLAQQAPLRGPEGSLASAIAESMAAIALVAGPAGALLSVFAGSLLRWALRPILRAKLLPALERRGGFVLAATRGDGVAKQMAETLGGYDVDDAEAALRRAAHLVMLAAAIVCVLVAGALVFTVWIHVWSLPEVILDGP